MTTYEMPAGRYYIGDLCYLLDDIWDEVCATTIKGDELVDGKFTLSDGREFVIFSTAYGDGVYPLRGGGHTASLGVDSGTIGCICVNDDNLPKFKLGTIVEFEEEFECLSADGVLTFGDISVTTGNEDDEVEELDELDFGDDFDSDEE
jgi:hypothetical protein